MIMLCNWLRHRTGISHLLQMRVISNINKFKQGQQLQSTRKQMRDKDYVTDLQTFKYTAERIQTFQELITFYRRNVDNENYEKYFTTMCINLSRIIRRLKSYQFHDINHFLGNDYQVLSKLDLNNLNAQELAHIMNLINIVAFRLPFNSKNKQLSGFVDRILTKALDPTTQHLGNRYIYKLCKAMRCAEIFNNSKYEQILKLILNKFQVLGLFDYLSIYNTLLRGNSKASIIELEEQFFKKSIQKIIQYKWIKISSIHTFSDLIQPIITIYFKYPMFTKQYGNFIKLLCSQLQGYLHQNYRQLTTQEIIRAIKIIQNLNQDSKIIKLILQTIFSGISLEESKKGYSAIDPIFIIRFIGHHHCSFIYDGIDENWQQKITSVIQQYFLYRKLPINTVIQTIIRIIDSSILSKSQSFRLLKVLEESILSCDSEKPMIQRQMINFSLRVIQLSIRKFAFEISARLLQNFSKLCSSSKTQPFYSLVYLETLTTFHIKLGIPIDMNRKQIYRNFGLSPGKVFIDENQSSLGYLSKAFLLNHEQSTSPTKISRYNSSFLVSTVQLLPYTLKFREFLKIYQVHSTSKQLFICLLTSAIGMSLPVEFRQALISIGQKSLKDPLYMIDLFFSDLRTPKNRDKRLSIQQAQYFLQLITSLPQPNLKLMYLSDSICLNFLLTFIPKITIKSILTLIQQNSQLVPNQYEFILMTIVYFLDQHCDDVNYLSLICQTIVKSDLIVLDAGRKKVIETIWDFYRGESPKVQSFMFRIQCFKDQNNMQMLNNYFMEVSQSVQNDNLGYQEIQRHMKFLIRIGIKVFQCHGKDEEIRAVLSAKLPIILLKLSNRMIRYRNQHLILKAFMLCQQNRLLSETQNSRQFFNTFLQVIKHQKLWHGYICSQQLFPVIADYYRTSTQVELSLLPILINLFWMSPTALFKELLSFINQLFENEKTVAELKKTQYWNYIMYLKYIEKQHKSLTFSVQ